MCPRARAPPSRGGSSPHGGPAAGRRGAHGGSAPRSGREAGAAPAPPPSARHSRHCPGPSPHPPPLSCTPCVGRAAKRFAKRFEATMTGGERQVSTTDHRPPDRSATRAATMANIAERAGVALSTVSYVLSGKRTVSPEIRERVLAAVE